MTEETRAAARDREAASGERAPRKPTQLSATEARQGEIILGRRGRWIWIVSLAIVVILAAVFGMGAT